MHAAPRDANTRLFGAVAVADAELAGEALAGLRGGALLALHTEAQRRAGGPRTPRLTAPIGGPSQPIGGSSPGGPSWWSRGPRTPRLTAPIGGPFPGGPSRWSRGGPRTSRRSVVPLLAAPAGGAGGPRTPRLTAPIGGPSPAGGGSYSGRRAGGEGDLAAFHDPRRGDARLLSLWGLPPSWKTGGAGGHTQQSMTRGETSGDCDGGAVGCVGR